MKRHFKKGKQTNNPIVSPPSNSDAHGIPSTSQRQPEDAKVSEIALEWADLVANVLKDVSEASEILAPLKATMALVIRGLEITRALNQNKKAWKDLGNNLSAQMKQITGWCEQLELGNRVVDPTAKAALADYLNCLLPIRDEITKAIERSKPGITTTLKRIGTTKLDQDAINDLSGRIDKAFQQFSGAMSIVLSSQISNLSQQVSNLQLEMQTHFSGTISSKQTDYGTADSFLRISYGRDLERCEEGTRTRILEAIRVWANNAVNDKPIFWLKDAAGTGKTTIAATMADEWLQAKRLAARFFFSPNSNATSVTTHFCLTLAKDMAMQLPSIAPTINAAITKSPAALFNFRQQFERIIIEPLRSLSPSSSLFIVVDAVDNCDPDDRTILLECVLARLPSIPNLKMLITSRPLSDIDDLLSKSPIVHGKDVQLMDVHDTTFVDIKLYVNNRLPKLTSEQRDSIISYSGGLFICAATMCRMLKRSRRPAQLLVQLLGAETSGHLDQLYLEALKQAVSDPDAHDLMMNVLEFVIAAFQPISISTIQTFLPTNDQVNAFVQDLGALLKDGHPDRPIFVIHPTFREFISHAERANGFLIDLPSSHTSMAIACIDLLNGLEYDLLHILEEGRLIPRNKDIVGLETLVDRHMTAAIKYASSYWAHHAAVSSNNADVWNKVSHFLSTKLLNWIELMSWRGNIAGCISGVSQLHTKSKEALPSDQRLLETSLQLDISHVYYFVLQNQRLLQESALHTYSTALAFSPQQSTLFQFYLSKYKDKAPVVILSSPLNSPSHQILAATSSLSQIEFSPDANRLITRTQNGAFQIWDTYSGAIITAIDQHHSQSVEHFAISQDGEHVVLANKGGNVLILSLRTGTQTGRTIDVAPESVNQVAFSPAGDYVFLVLKHPRNEIRCWSVKSPPQVKEPLVLHGSVLWISPSPDGQRLVSASYADDTSFSVTVTLWDLNTSVVRTAFELPRIWDKKCICFSTTGDRFALWDGHGNISLRETISGVLVSTTKMYDHGVEGALFSSTDDFLAARSDYSTDIALWCLRTDQISYLKGHSSTVVYLCFSLDGERLASVGNDQTVQVWEVSTKTTLQSFFTGYTGRIRHPLLSIDWSKFVTVGINHQINLYDLSLGAAQGAASTEDPILVQPVLAFSPKDGLFVCGYDHIYSLQLWRLDTASLFGKELTGHDGGITSVAFSFDGKRVASGSWDKTIRLWDPYTQEQFGQVMGGHSDKVLHLAFSPNNLHLASISSDSIQLWDVATTTNLLNIKTGRAEGCLHIAFSPNSFEVAGFVGRGDKLCLWNLSGGIRSTESAYAGVDGLAFSPAGNVLASVHGVPEDCIVLWQVEKKITPIARLDIGRELHRSPSLEPYKLSISPDGYMVFGLSIWNISYSPPRLLGSNQRPNSLLNQGDGHRSLLFYLDGWIYSAYPRGRLLPIPDYLQESLKSWEAIGNKVVGWTEQGGPLVIDCSPLLVSSK